MICEPNAPGAVGGKREHRIEARRFTDPYGQFPSGRLPPRDPPWTRPVRSLPLWREGADTSISWLPRRRCLSRAEQVEVEGSACSSGFSVVHLELT